MSGSIFFSSNIVFFLFENLFTLTNSVDSDEMLYYAAFILVSTVYKSIHLWVSGYKRLKAGVDFKRTQNSHLSSQSN